MFEEPISLFIWFWCFFLFEWEAAWMPGYSEPMRTSIEFDKKKKSQNKREKSQSNEKNIQWQWSAMGNPLNCVFACLPVNVVDWLAIIVEQIPIERNEISEILLVGYYTSVIQHFATFT